jgi:hypothetical protein
MLTHVPQVNTLQLVLYNVNCVLLVLTLVQLGLKYVLLHLLVDMFPQLDLQLLYYQPLDITFQLLA